MQLSISIAYTLYILHTLYIYIAYTDVQIVHASHAPYSRSAWWIRGNSRYNRVSRNPPAAAAPPSPSRDEQMLLS